ncbi:MAG: TrbG/VirB9 family P-type conjugative transfer protein [Burkholderiaceae bacterium]|jgi:type IV secretion system protein VirB9|nr:TrbG/VirB9 family P-type conjugative transfer protein [Burkholderiaceae bacterium]
MKPPLPLILSAALLATGGAWADDDAPVTPPAPGTTAGASASAAVASELNPLLNHQSDAAPPPPAVPIPSNSTELNSGANQSAPPAGIAPTVVPVPAPAPAAAAPAATLAQQIQSPPRAPRMRAPRPVPVNSITNEEIEQADKIWQRVGQAGGVIGTNGTVMYAYGESRPTINCAPLHLCVIQLIAGEQITDLSIGDSVRWKVAASRAGDAPVVVTKPVTAHLETNLTVLTDQGRVYYMTLKSTTSNYVPLVQYYNPQEIIEKINARTGQMHAQAQAAQETKDASLGKLDPATMDFNYACKGEASFKPSKVFSGNGHVYLQMPDDMKYHDAPAAFDQSNDTTQLINSRLTRGYTILDGLPEKFKLVVGVGSDAQTIECAHGKNDGNSNRWNRDNNRFLNPPN